MDSTEKLAYTQPNYDLIVKKAYWTINEALVYLAFYYLRHKSYKTEQEAEAERVTVGDNIYHIIQTGIKAKELLLAETVYDCENDKQCDEINIHKSKINPIYFVVWALKNNIDIPIEFINILLDLGGKFDKRRDLHTHTESDIVYDVEEVKYPIYKGVELEDLSKEKFDDIKKYYGMLQEEVKKLNKTIGIATRIGLLFYENNLPKPANAPIFREAYNKAFDGIPMRLVERIYNSLPEEYKSYTDRSVKPDINEDTLASIIDASVAAGLIRSKGELANVKELEQKLINFELEALPTEHLKGISGACRRLYKKFKAEEV
ncbi:hypothetical protein E4633_15045 [Geomonas terrae]|uniref:Uncharacterized protein n=1 Tax=Geomonas terrae TaxID=2562681 RepID=A0A4S1CEE3_9BACT|nr:hypothetical protein [Geomonas terrae]TGU71623.1 hypothetical protein E4633_15045 [Geomonas terrae]